MAAPLTWKNVGATVSGSSAGTTLAGGVKTVLGAFDPAKQLLEESQAIEDKNLKQSGVNLNLAEQDRIRSIGSLAEYNQMREAGELDPVAARERVGFQFDAGAAQQTQEDQLSRLRTKASGEAMSAGRAAGDESLSSITGAQAYQEKLRELGASEDYVRSQGADYVASDTLNAAQYAEDIKQFTSDSLADFTPKSNAELESKLGEFSKDKRFDADLGRAVLNQRKTGTLVDITRARDEADRVKGERLDKATGVYHKALTSGKSTAEAEKLGKVGLSDDQLTAFTNKTAGLEDQLSALSNKQKIKFNQKQAKAGRTITRAKSDGQAKIDSLQTTLDKGGEAITQETADGFRAAANKEGYLTDRVDAMITAGLFAGMFAGPDGTITGQAAKDFIGTKYRELVATGGVKDEVAAALVYQSLKAVSDQSTVWFGGNKGVNELAFVDELERRAALKQRNDQSRSLINEKQFIHNTTIRNLEDTLFQDLEDTQLSMLNKNIGTGKSQIAQAAGKTK